MDNYGELEDKDDMNKDQHWKLKDGSSAKYLKFVALHNIKPAQINIMN